MTTCPAVQLGNISFNDSADSDGIVWSWTSIDGWEAPDVALSPLDRPGTSGQILATGLYRGRQMVLNGHAFVDGDLTKYWLARNKLAQQSDFVAAGPGTLTVAEPVPKQASVYRAQRLRYLTMGELTALEFSVPLMSPDYRKYGTTLHSSVIGGSGSIANAGDARSAPTITLTGATAAPGLAITNTTDTSRSVVLARAVAGGDTVVIDLAARTVSFNGTIDQSAIDISTRWWELRPGANNLSVASGSMQVQWRDAYL